MHPFPINPYTGRSGRPHPRWAVERDWQLQQQRERERSRRLSPRSAPRLRAILRAAQRPAAAAGFNSAAIPSAWFRPA